MSFCHLESEKKNPLRTLNRDLAQIKCRGKLGCGDRAGTLATPSSVFLTLWHFCQICPNQSSFHSPKHNLDSDVIQPTLHLKSVLPTYPSATRSSSSTLTVPPGLQARGRPWLEWRRVACCPVYRL